MAKVQYFGKYRAKVQNTNDPSKRGRIRVLCPKVLNDAVSNWCEPCVPVAYDSGGDFAIPKVGETVWVEFEEGDVNKPIYTGGWWSSDSTPVSPYDVSTRCIEWNGCKILMKSSNGKSSVEITVGRSSLIISEDSIEAYSPNTPW